MTPQEALAQALRCVDLSNMDSDDLAAAILDALRNVPGGRWLVINRDEWDVLCERIGAQQERERLRQFHKRDPHHDARFCRWCKRLADPEPDR